MRIKIIVTTTATLAALLFSGCSADEPEAATPTPAVETTEASGESEACLELTEEWLSVYDNLDEATSLEDPTAEMASKVADDAADLSAPIRTACSAEVVAATGEADQGIAKVAASITACSFTDMCGTIVDDALDETMTSVDSVRELVGA